MTKAAASALIAPHANMGTSEMPTKHSGCKNRKNMSNSTFPSKLMNILSRKEYEHLVSWLPDGKSFRIFDPKLFASTILPVHLKQAKYSSFKRNLQRWGFKHDAKDGRAKCKGLEVTFWHELFQRDQLDLLWRMAPLNKPVHTSMKSIEQKQRSLKVPINSNPIVSCFEKPMFSGNHPDLPTSATGNEPTGPAGDPFAALNQLSAESTMRLGNNSTTQFQNGVPFKTASPSTSLKVSFAETMKQKKKKKNVGLYNTMRKFSNKREFPLKLMSVLTCKEFAHIVAWRSDGKSLCVLNKKEFVESIMPLYLKLQSYVDFEKKMKNWKFNSVTDTKANTTTFEHEFFQKDRLDLIKYMKPVDEVLLPKQQETSKVPGLSKKFSLSERLDYAKSLAGPITRSHPVDVASLGHAYPRHHALPRHHVLPQHHAPCQDTTFFPTLPQGLSAFPHKPRALASSGSLSVRSIQKMRLDAAIQLEVKRRLEILGYGQLAR